MYYYKSVKSGAKRFLLALMGHLGVGVLKQWDTRSGAFYEPAMGHQLGEMNEELRIKDSTQSISTYMVMWLSGRGNSYACCEASPRRGGAWFKFTTPGRCQTITLSKKSFLVYVISCLPLGKTIILGQTRNKSYYYKVKMSHLALRSLASA